MHTEHVSAGIRTVRAALNQYGALRKDTCFMFVTRATYIYIYTHAIVYSLQFLPAFELRLMMDSHWFSPKDTMNQSNALCLICLTVRLVNWQARGL